MHARLFASALIVALATSPASAQQTGQTASPGKPETSCTASAAAGQATGETTGSTAKSMSIEKNAILPSAGGHANSAAPTVQNDGEAMQVRPDCPPDQTKPK